LVDHAGTLTQLVLGTLLELLEIHPGSYLRNHVRCRVVTAVVSSQPRCVRPLPHSTPFTTQRQPPPDTLPRTWCDGDADGATRAGYVGSAAREPPPVPG